MSVDAARFALSPETGYKSIRTVGFPFLARPHGTSNGSFGGSDMLSRILMTALVLAGLTCGLASQGQDASPKDDFNKTRDDLSLKEKILQKQYQEFELQVL